ncbi:enoyl-CoA hydratase [uncultured Sneathiella sp.]|jgi:enoyl-CoA hydratase/carnithine racemase|uniref:enoyl-CoA hydratase n=1 Tax=uncultured Sneathiella sp. TaxID=879315 RepID=UPI0030DA38CF|tara:strand:- start:12713 stop:13675 length:963 start_codon:yes stop_codon:yes gene_type:complete
MNSNLIRHVEINLAYPLSPPKIKTREDLIIKFGYSNIPAIIKKGIVMAYEHIVFEQENGVATVTLNRPDKLNAWTRTMEREVRNAMEEADKDGDIRVIVLTGAGRGFCAGADMDLLSGIEDGSEKREPGAVYGTEAYNVAIRADFQTRYSYFPSISKPIIGAINGPAAGLGMVISLYCDMRFASREAVFMTAFAKRGLIAEHGISWMLPRLIGHSAALDLLLSSRKVTAEEALRLGLVNQVHDSEALLPAVMAYANDLANNVSPRSMAVMKQQVYNAQFQTLNEAVATGNEEMLKSFASEDFKEGVAHFIEKRPANFSGK